MNQEEENRARRNHVSKLYPGWRWQEKVASMPTEQVTAIYLKSIRDGTKPRPESPEFEQDLREEQEIQDAQFRLF